LGDTFQNESPSQFFALSSPALYESAFGVSQLLPEHYDTCIYHIDVLQSQRAYDGPTLPEALPFDHGPTGRYPKS
jgi:hypothetical protein